MRAPDDLPDDLEGDFRAGEIRDTRTAPECVERDRYEDYDSLWERPRRARRRGAATVTLRI
jgi:hypothetical protein